MSEFDRFQVVLQPSGLTFHANAGETLLLAARSAGIAMPNACRNGTCRRCLCRLIEGRIAYLIEWPGLSREEKAEGDILPCVACARSSLSIVAPQAVGLPAAP